MLSILNLRKNVVLAPFTTYHIGGPADFFVEVTTQKDLIDAIQEARKQNIPYFIMGCGANILIRDEGIRGLVIRNMVNDYEFLSDHTLRASSGALIETLIDACIEKELSGLEHFVGIPSSVGGAIWQNLHFLSPDRTSTLYIGDTVISAKILDENNLVRFVDNSFFKFGYDDSTLHHQEIVVLEVHFQLVPKPKETMQQTFESNMAWRIAKQPQLAEYPSCGSVFKKIEGVGAGRLIEKVGLKGAQIGQIKISEKHANYLINLGEAKAKDVEAMIKHVQTTVKQKTGYHLEPEIQIIGEE